MLIYIYLSITPDYTRLSF